MPSSVVGIDMGSWCTCIAQIENGGVVVLANEMSQRSSLSVVSLPIQTHGSRQSGASARPHLVTQPASAVAEVRDLLSWRHVRSQIISLHREAEKIHKPPNLKSDAGKEESFTPSLWLRYRHRLLPFAGEQLVAQFYHYLNKNVILKTKKNNNNIEPDYVVLSVPSYMSDPERIAVIDAARIARINVVGIINDVTAVALAYGFFQKDLPAGFGPPINAASSEFDPATAVSAPPLMERPRWVAFVDVGHRSFEASWVSLTKDGLKVWRIHAKRYLGAGNLDDCIAQLLSQRFSIHYPGAEPIVPATKRPWAKLLVAAAEVKKALSVTREPVPVRIECLVQDLDLRTMVTREDLENEVGRDMFEDLRSTLNAFVLSAPCDIRDVYAVEVVGGATRIPIVKTIIQEAFGGITPSTTLNADEAVAKGCALYCASLTRVYRMRPFRVEDNTHPFNVIIRYVPNNPSGMTKMASPSRALVPVTHDAVAPVIMTLFERSGSVGPEVRVDLGVRPAGDIIFVEYNDAERILNYNWIASYRFLFDEEDLSGKKRHRLLLDFVSENGIVRLKSATLHGDEGEDKVLKFIEKRSGGLTSDQLNEYIRTEDIMRQSDEAEEYRQEVKNQLEESTFRFQDSLQSEAEHVTAMKDQDIWRLSVDHVAKLKDLIDGGGSDDDYESWTSDDYSKALEELGRKISAFNNFKETFRLHKTNSQCQGRQQLHHKNKRSPIHPGP